MGVTDLLREADIALYRAKDAGRDRFVVFDDGLRARVLSRQRAERRLREALEQDLLVLEYQPIVDFVGGRIVGAEALIRMKDVDDGGKLLGPDMFIDVAEDTGLVVEVDSWVIEAAIRAGRRLGRPDRQGRRPALGRDQRVAALDGAPARRPPPGGRRQGRRGAEGPDQGRADRAQLPRRAARQRGVAAVADGGRRPGGHRRLRHRLLGDGLPPAVRPRLHEDRPVVRRRTSARRSGRTPSSPRSSTSPTRTACG